MDVPFASRIITIRAALLKLQAMLQMITTLDCQYETLIRAVVTMKQATKVTSAELNTEDDIFKVVNLPFFRFFNGINIKYFLLDSE